MKKRGAKIITTGVRNIEEEMINCLLKLGYKGPFGILGHVKSEDVELTLKKNLKGLQSLFLVN
jgi:hypothetical protein